MEKDQLKFVIVGHVDHGKSTLIGRILFDTGSLFSDKMDEIKKFSEKLGRTTEFAFLMDHLQEEREQGITIETAQNFFKTKKREYVIIDVPGHVEFVRNMITGASQAGAAVLIIDAKEGVQVQTKRHANILSILGLKNIIVVVNKMDMVEYKQEAFEKIKKDIEDFLKTINLNVSYFIPVSALSGENIIKLSSQMPWYNGPFFIDALDSLEKTETKQSNILIFPVQDVYKIEDKRIFVGRIERGSIKTGDEIKVLPQNTKTKVKTIEGFNKTIELAEVGENIGITTEDPLFLERGNILCREGDDLKITDTFYANIFWLRNKEMEKDTVFSFKCATQEVMAEIKEIRKIINSSTLEVLENNSGVLQNLEVGEVLIKTKKPVVLTSFKNIEELGRFILVDGENICAGGTII